MKNILVSGGEGFIGSHTSLALLERGYSVYVIDSFKNSSPKALEKVLDINSIKNKDKNGNLYIFKGDIRDNNFLDRFFIDIYKIYIYSYPKSIDMLYIENEIFSNLIDQRIHICKLKF